MKTDQKLFLLELSSLLKKNRATMFYTNDDDGIHIAADGQEVFAGHLDENAGAVIYQSILKGV